jgi:acyl carrier protein
MDLDFFVLCSSIASFLGGIGLVDYCAANAYMDAYVTQKRFRSTETMLSINWDMWGEVGMGLKTQMPDELKEWLAKELRDGITSSEGTDVLQRILTWRRSKNVIVSTRDLQARVDLWIKREFIKEKESLMEDENTQPKYMRPNLSSDYAAPENEIEAKIAAMLGKLFGFEKVGRNDSFYELGGHSLLATTLVSKLKKEFNVSLSIRDILDHPVLSELAGFIRSKREEKANTETAS